MNKLITLILIFTNTIVLNANDISNEIINNKAITIKSTPSLSEAQNIANKLHSYDIYIYKTKTNIPPLYVLYALNIKKENRYIALEDILKVSSDAYLTSQKRINLIPKNSFSQNMFIKKNTNPKRHNSFYYNYMAKINSNIREEANNNSKIVGILFKNQKIHVKNTKNNWHETKLGFIFHNLLKKNYNKKPHIKIKPYSKSLLLKQSFYKKIKPYKVKTIEKKIVDDKKESLQLISNINFEKEFKSKALKNNLKIKKTINSKPKNIVINKINTKKDDSRNYFIGVSYAYNYFNNKLKDNISSINANIGKNLNNRYSVYFNYNKYGYKNMDIDSFYMSMDYNFNYKIKPFVGISMGSNYISYNSNGSDSNTFLYGLQSGLKYKINNNIDFTSKLAYFKFKYDEDLLSSNINMDNSDQYKSSLEIGFRYYF